MISAKIECQKMTILSALNLCFYYCSHYCPYQTIWNVSSIPTFIILTNSIIWRFFLLDSPTIFIPWHLTPLTFPIPSIPFYCLLNLLLQFSCTNQNQKWLTDVGILISSFNFDLFTANQLRIHLIYLARTYHCFRLSYYRKSWRMFHSLFWGIKSILGRQHLKRSWDINWDCTKRTARRYVQTDCTFAW